MENVYNSKIGEQKNHVSEAASELLKESKKLANELYEEGMNKVTDMEQQVKEYSDKLLEKVKEKPLTSLLVAGGVGFLLSRIMK